MKNLLLLSIIAVLCGSCAVSKPFNPNTKIAPQKLQQDYALFRNILEDTHPGLYWYTTKDSMDYYFASGAAMLKDSMTETKFRNILSYVIAKMHCGHTAVTPSKAAS